MIKNLLFLLSIVLFLFSCEVEGPMGPQGTAGQNGQNGKDGQDGNANVVSEVFTINTSDWVEHGTFGSITHYYDVTLIISEITNDIFQSGSVIAYLKSSSDTYIALPYTFTDIGYYTTYSFGYQVGKLIIEIQDSDFMTLRPDSQITAKIVIVESTNP